MTEQQRPFNYSGMAAADRFWRRAGVMLWALPCCLALMAVMPVAVMVDKPVTVTVAVPEPSRHAEAVLLRLEGVTMRRNVPVTWNIFWELPKADARTSLNNIHFAGFISSPANSALRDPKPVSFLLPMPPPAVAVLHHQPVVRLTFVPIGKLPEGGVTITSIRLE